MGSWQFLLRRNIYACLYIIFVALLAEIPIIMTVMPKSSSLNYTLTRSSRMQSSNIKISYRIMPKVVEDAI